MQVLPSGRSGLAIALTHLRISGVSLANPAGDCPHLIIGPKLATAIWVYLKLFLISKKKLNRQKPNLPLSPFLIKSGPPESPLQWLLTSERLPEYVHMWKL